MSTIKPLGTSSQVGAPAGATRLPSPKKSVSMPQVSAASQNDAAIVAVAARNAGNSPASLTERSYIQTDNGRMRSEIERVEETSSFEGVKLDTSSDDPDGGKKDP